MEKFTRLFAWMAIAIPLFTSCYFSSRPTTYGNYQVINKEIRITDYDEIVVGLAANIVYQQFSDSVPYLQINTDDNIFPALDVRVEGNKLIIETKVDSVISPTQLTIYTNSKSLKKAQLNGSGELYLRGEVNAKDFELNLTGSGNVRTDSLICENMAVNLAGSGNTQLVGAAKTSTFTVSGSGKINAFGFLVQSLACTVAGSGDIEACPKDKLDATVTGSGNIWYKGVPEFINSSVIGSGEIKQTE